LFCLCDSGVRHVDVVVHRVESARARLAARLGGRIIDADKFQGPYDAAIVTAPYGVLPSIVPKIEYGGRIVYNGLSMDSTVAYDMLDLHTRKIALIPSFPHPQRDFASSIERLTTHVCELSLIVSHRLLLSEAGAVFKTLCTSTNGDAVKVVISP
jgi:threonine dehydrogenase-like Zn-dependent dehydrogenase